MAGCRTPAATASTAAAAASSRARRRRPPWAPLLSFALPAGSEIVRASDIAERSSSDGHGVTRPSAQARRNDRTSAPPYRESHTPCLERCRWDSGLVERVPQFGLPPPVGHDPRRTPEPLQRHRQQRRNVRCPLSERQQFTAPGTFPVESRHAVTAAALIERRLARERRETRQRPGLRCVARDRGLSRARSKIDPPHQRPGQRRVHPPGEAGPPSSRWLASVVSTRSSLASWSMLTAATALRAWVRTSACVVLGFSHQTQGR